MESGVSALSITISTSYIGKRTIGRDVFCGVLAEAV
jgi:hypothetical protein